MESSSTTALMSQEPVGCYWHIIPKNCSTHTNILFLQSLSEVCNNIIHSHAYLLQTRNEHLNMTLKAIPELQKAINLWGPAFPSSQTCQTPTIAVVSWFSGPTNHVKTQKGSHTSPRLNTTHRIQLHHRRRRAAAAAGVCSAIQDFIEAHSGCQ